MRREMDVRRHVGSLALAAATTAFLVSMAALGAQGPPAGAQGNTPSNQTAPPEPPPPTPLVPVTASSVVRAPDLYLGETVTLTATVESSLSPLTFTVDQDRTKATGKAVLVIARRLNEPIKPNEYVTVIGDLIKFDAAEIAKHDDGGFTVDLPADVATKYAGQPVVLATTVFQSGNDIAMRLPPPMTEDETALAEAMKRIAPANAALSKALEAEDVALARENAGILEDAFDEAKNFFGDQDADEAEDQAEAAQALSETIDSAAEQGQWESVKAEVGNLGKMCASCHGTYRERFDDGSFRFKKPGPGEGGR